MAYTPNESEQQFKEFLESQDHQCCYLSLRPQGMNTIIDSDKAVNLATVSIQNNEYQFGGISERFYDSMVMTHHWTEKKVRISEEYQNRME